MRASTQSRAPQSALSEPIGKIFHEIAGKNQNPGVEKVLDRANSVYILILASGTSRPLKAGSANRAGSGHGGSGETPDVRLSKERRTKNAPEDETDLMPRSVFCFQPLMREPANHRPSRIMTSLAKLPSLRVDAENPNHHLWDNHGTWFLHYTIHPTPLTKERIRRSLGTKDVLVARERRDNFFAMLANNAAAKPTPAASKHAAA